VDADVLKYGNVDSLFVEFGIEFECSCDLFGLLGGCPDRAALVVLKDDQLIVLGGRPCC
jgi:hypothetical protein